MPRYRFPSVQVIAHDRLKELLHYDSNTGVWTRLKRGGNQPAGSVAGCLSRGYLVFRVSRRLYCAHILAWFYMTGKWPEHEIDHKDLNRSNNKWSNLREANDSQQAGNKPMMKNRPNKFGMPGVKKAKGTFFSEITVDEQYYYLGTFPSAEAASAAYVAKHIDLRGEYSVYA